MFGRPKAGSPNDVFSHWHQTIEEMTFTPQEFYTAIENQVVPHEIPGVKLEEVTHRERFGPLANRRIYLRISRKGMIFDICGAPFGKGFFVSWWLGEKPASLLQRIGIFLSYIPIIGDPFLGVREQTYFQVDSMLMFRDLVQAAVVGVLDEQAEAQGIRGLTETQKRPEMNLMGR